MDAGDERAAASRSWRRIRGGAAPPPGIEQPIARAGSTALAHFKYIKSNILFFFSPRVALKANWQPFVLGCTQFLILSGGQDCMAEVWELNP